LEIKYVILLYKKNLYDIMIQKYELLGNRRIISFDYAKGLMLKN